MVIITDRSSGESPEYIRAVVRPLEIAGIRVIAVAVGKEVDVNETKAISSGGKAIETGNKGASKVGREIVEEIAKGNLISDYVYVAFGNLNTDFELRISDLQCMIKRKMQKRILTPRNSSLTFFYFRFLEIPRRIFKHYFDKSVQG